MTEIYQKLGVQPVINCATTYTRLGGSIMAPHVAQAMADSAGVFVNIFDLQEAVGKRLAELTHNEAAYVSNGAAAALTLATAAAVTGNDVALMARFPNRLDGLKNQVVVHRYQRNWYDVAVRLTGVELVEIGHTYETYDWELDDAINDRTAAVIYFAGTHLNRNTLPLEYVIERAHARGVPVIVDAAAQLPPASNLWHFTRDLGADVAIFSGGKLLRGPQNSGLAVGTEKMIEAMRLNGPPVQRIGRPMKVSKEAMIGLLAAVETYLETDHDAEALKWETVVASWQTAWQELAPRWLTVERSATGEAGEPIPRILMRVSPDAPLSRDDLIEGLHAGNPPIEVVVENQTTIA
ncbi:MAG: aminotransferase class V-fold PLP-dependent enzyme, partial [Thermomicrobiales bacterium]|nr:aminotransferase class V-fold PLP-dependent enzyme [Thermomicrobiales bacterium]